MHQQFHVSLTHSTHFGQVTTCVSLADHCSTWSLSLLLFHSLRSRIRFIRMLVIAVLAATLCWDWHTGMDILSAPIDRRAPFAEHSITCQSSLISLSLKLWIVCHVIHHFCVRLTIVYIPNQTIWKDSDSILELRLLKTWITPHPTTVMFQPVSIVLCVSRTLVDMELLT